MCLCYSFSSKTAWQLVNRKADFLQNESISITNRIDSNREWNALPGGSSDPIRHVSSCSGEAGLLTKGELLYHVYFT